MPRVHSGASRSRPLKNHEYHNEPVKKLMSITCDVCDRTHDDQLEMQEFWSFSDVGGYGNVAFGDMNKIELDMCQYCAKRLLGPYIRINPT